MIDKLELEVTKTDLGNGIEAYLIDTDYDVESCHITDKNQVKIKTKSGQTEMTEPLVKDTNYTIVVYQYTRFAFKVVFIPNATRQVVKA